jgi:hypothetical protein
MNINITWIFTHRTHELCSVEMTGMCKKKVKAGGGYVFVVLGAYARALTPINVLPLQHKTLHEPQ